MKWTNAEKEQLISLAKQFTKNKRIQWSVIAQALQKTANQCKTMYTIQLKQRTESVTQKWSEEEMRTLILCVTYFGKDWAFLQKVYFQNRTKEQIRLKFQNTLKSLVQMKETLTQIVSKNEIPPGNQLRTVYDYLTYVHNEQHKYYQQQALIDKGELTTFTDPMLANFIQFHIIQEIEQKCLKCSLDDCINIIQKLLHNEQLTQ
uniref:Myb-like DNA-binding domain-containing protein n=1 Tax=Trepomonas sp. PC1 TaxID=1076344 RepID=A0A146K5H9_9EUKA|eukprot:JAP92160.1 Myb-like DNA-binding domain-containing protein [Trepomonas sp. PC1]